MGRRRTRPLRAALVAIGLVLWLPLSSAGVDHSLYDRFYGTYEGEAVLDAQGEMGKRDISVTIGPEESGFYVSWVSTTHKPDGRLKRKAYSVTFAPTSRSGIYRSAMRKNMFGQVVPMDPMKGDPYVWATVAGDTLTVYALHVTDSGGYEMQTYIRTLVEGGMTLEFSRLRDGEPLRTVTGTLKRVR